MATLDNSKKYLVHNIYGEAQTLIDDIGSSGMDPNYEITCNGISTGDIAIDMIPF